MSYLIRHKNGSVSKADSKANSGKDQGTPSSAGRRSASVRGGQTAARAPSVAGSGGSRRGSDVSLIHPIGTPAPIPTGSKKGPAGASKQGHRPSVAAGSNQAQDILCTPADASQFGSQFVQDKAAAAQGASKQGSQQKPAGAGSKANHKPSVAGPQSQMPQASAKGKQGGNKASAAAGSQTQPPSGAQIGTRRSSIAPLGSRVQFESDPSTIDISRRTSLTTESRNQHHGSSRTSSRASLEANSRNQLQPYDYNQGSSRSSRPSSRGTSSLEANSRNQLQPYYGENEAYSRGSDSRNFEVGGVIELGATRTSQAMYLNVRDRHGSWSIYARRSSSTFRSVRRHQDTSRNPELDRRLHDLDRRMGRMEERMARCGIEKAMTPPGGYPALESPTFPRCCCQGFHCENGQAYESRCCCRDQRHDRSRY